MGAKRLYREYNNGELIKLECSRCREIKDAKEFTKNNRLVDGKDTTCKSCKAELRKLQSSTVTREYRENYYKENKERLNDMSREYYKVHREEIKAKRMQQRDENLEAYREYQKQYREAHKEKMKTYQAEYRKQKKLNKE